MPISRGSPRPVIITMAPSNSGDKVAPPSPSSAKAVRFASSSSGLVRTTRQPSPTEEWPAWHFEDHASRCRTCTDSLAGHLRGAPLCEAGRVLASDVQQHLYHDYATADVYSHVRDEKDQPVRVELHVDYSRVRKLLKALAMAKYRRRPAPVVTYDDEPANGTISSLSARQAATTTAVPSSAKDLDATSSRRRHTGAVIFEPSDSRSSRPAASSRSKHRSTRYNTTVVQSDVEAEIAAPSTASATAGSARPKLDDRRGSLYESDTRRVQRSKTYRIVDRDEARQQQQQRRHK